MSANGYLQPNELTSVQGSIQLSNATARAWFAMKNEASKEGVNITIAAPVGGYRSRAVQVDMRNRPWLYNITPGIVPGLPSEHGNGNCVDIASGLSWVKANGHRWGFYFPLAFDPNHAEYDGSSFAGEIGDPIDTNTDAKQQRKVNPVLSITRVIRKGVGEFIMYASATNIRLTPELSANPDKNRRAFELGVASAIAQAVGLPAEIPTLDDTPNGGWYLRNQLAASAAGMPADFPLSSTNPFNALTYKA